MLYRLLSHLLDYPSREYYQNLDELHAVTQSDDSLTDETRQTLQTFIKQSQSLSLTALQEQYVNTFDMNENHSLLLTHHTLGDDRGRGPALIELDEHYKENGFEVNGNRELPDYLPLILEYVSTLDKTEANWFLSQMKRVLQLLAENLENANSIYASLIRLVEAQAVLIQPADKANAP